jgi:peroxiredoxin Q/BCP
MSSLKAGDIAPDFRLAADNGTHNSLADFRGKFVLLYFFPKALTPG